MEEQLHIAMSKWAAMVAAVAVVVALGLHLPEAASQQQPMLML